jgi:CheY-like chemotaxis protein
MEPDTALRDLTALVLERLGYVVLPAASVADAIAIAKDHASVDLLLTDIGPPAINGDELVEQIREKHPRLKVLFTSGYPEGESPRTETAKQMPETLRKPYAPTALARSVHGLLQPGTN